MDRHKQTFATNFNTPSRIIHKIALKIVFEIIKIRF